MSAESNFGELFRKLVDQFQLSPSVATTLLQRILDILAQEAHIEESEETDA